MQDILSNPICHFTNELGNFTVGGVGTYINELLQLERPDMTFILLNDDPATTMPPYSHAHRVGYYEMDTLQSLRFETAIFHSYSLAYLAHASFLRGAKLIYVIHSVPTTIPWTLQQPFGNHHALTRSFEHLCEVADEIVCVSEAERGKLLTIYPDLFYKVSVILNGSSLPFSPLRVRNNSERYPFGFLGRCDERKGLRELCAAMQHVPGVLEIGCGLENNEYEQQVKHLIDKLGLNSRIHWRGRLDGSAKRVFWERIDALVVPSLWEPFGYVALEALRNGVLPIVSQNGGMTEIVGPDYRYTFNPWIQSSLINCILRFITDDLETVNREFANAAFRANALTAMQMAESLRELANKPRREHIVHLNRKFSVHHGPYIHPREGDGSKTPARSVYPLRPHSR